MGSKNLYSKRKKRIKHGSKPEVYQYDKLPIEFRRQVIHIWCSAIGFYTPVNRYGQTVQENQINQTWHNIHNSFARELGKFYLGSERDDPFTQCQQFLLDLDTPFDNLLDVIEFTFHYIDNDLRKIRIQIYYEFGERSDSFQSPDDAISELNHRFREHAIGYQYNNGQIIRVDSGFVHAEIVVPALSLLSNHDFQGAEQEFRNAHKHYQKQEYKDAIVDALNAFESTIKTICKKSGWSYSDKASARELIKTMFDNELIPKYLESYFASLRSLLESGVPTVRNRTSGHGQGEFPVDVPEYLAAYVLHLTASNIVLLVEAYQDKKIKTSPPYS